MLAEEIETIESLQDHDYWKEITREEATNLNTKEYEKDYGHGQRTYRNKVFRLTLEDRYFLVATEKWTEEELKSLAPYCICDSCQYYQLYSGWAVVWYFAKYGMPCGCCCGCVKSHFPSAYIVQLARRVRRRELDRATFG